jgi:hypothetical protein
LVPQQVSLQIRGRSTRCPCHSLVCFIGPWVWSLIQQLSMPRLIVNSKPTWYACAVCAPYGMPTHHMWMALNTQARRLGPFCWCCMT